MTGGVGAEGTAGTREAAGANLLEKKAWTVKEVAVMLQISVAMAYNMVRNGSIPSITLGVRRRIIPKDAFELWLRGTDKKK